MYHRIFVPVDLAHVEKLGRALDTAATLAGQGGATVIYAGVTADTPGPVAHTPAEFKKKLEAFAAEQGDAHGIATDAHAIRSHDPAIDMGDKLVEAAKDVSADLVVMASHVPGVTDHWFHGNAAHVAQHAPMSVFVVR